MRDPCDDATGLRPWKIDLAVWLNAEREGLPRNG